jgi:hypothetical protein
VAQLAESNKPPPADVHYRLWNVFNGHLMSETASTVSSVIDCFVFLGRVGNGQRAILTGRPTPQTFETVRYVHVPLTQFHILPSLRRLVAASMSGAM